MQPFRQAARSRAATGSIGDVRHARDRAEMGEGAIMDPREVRLLEQYTSLEYILLGDLRDLLEEPPDDESRRWLR